MGFSSYLQHTEHHNLNPQLECVDCNIAIANELNESYNTGTHG